MRLLPVVVALALGLTACASGELDGFVTSRRGGADDPAVDLPPAGGLSLDTAGTDAYGDLATAPMTVRGEVEATGGLAGVESDGIMVTTTPGAFTHPVDAPVGLSLVPFVARDVEGHVAKAHRSLLRAGYLPEGELDPVAGRIALTPELLLGLAGGDVASLDLSSFVPPGTSFATGPCNLQVDSVRNGPPQMSLAMNDAGQLVATVTVSDLAVAFQGQCMVDIPVLGSLNASALEGSRIDETTVVVEVVLEPDAVAAGSCLAGFHAVSTAVAIPALDLDLRIAASGIPSEVCLPPFGYPCLGTADLLGEAVGELAEGFVADLLEDQLQDAVGGAVDDLLAGFGGIDEETRVDFFDTPITVGICLTELAPTDGQLVATLGARASSASLTPGAAPGAPFLETTPMGTTPGALLLDPNLIGQLLFAAYQGGALEMEDIAAGSSVEVDVGLIALFAPGLLEIPGVDRNTPVHVDIGAELAPLTWAPESGTADLMLGMGQLRITLRTDDRTLMVLGAHVELAADLAPGVAGGIAVTAIPAESVATVWVEQAAVELSESEMDGLEGALQAMLLEQLPALLGGTEIGLPDLGVPLTPGDIRRVPGGFLEIPLL